MNLSSMVRGREVLSSNTSNHDWFSHALRIVPGMKDRLVLNWKNRAGFCNCGWMNKWVQVIDQKDNRWLFRLLSVSLLLFWCCVGKRCLLHHKQLFLGELAILFSWDPLISLSLCRIPALTQIDSLPFSLTLQLTKYAFSIFLRFYLCHLSHWSLFPVSSQRFVEVCDWIVKSSSVKKESVLIVTS